VAAGALTIADLRNGDAVACTLAGGSVPSLSVHRQFDSATMARLDALIDDIFERLSDDRLNELPNCIWALMVYADQLSRNRTKDTITAVTE
jgi:hypothetical protein